MSSMTDVLDNPVWQALTGVQSAWALRQGEAVRFVPEAAPFFAVPHLGAQAFRDLAQLVRQAPTAALVLPTRVPAPAGAEARLFLPHAIATPPGWSKTFEKPLIQMLLVAPPNARTPAGAIVELGPADLAEILDLARRAEPGPFGPRTLELGRFLGIRRDGRLVAMAGERMRLPGFTEISAVATDPTDRGRGLGGALTAELARRIRATGSHPFLHVFPDNPAAPLYRRLGFVERASLTVTWFRLNDDCAPDAGLPR